MPDELTFYTAEEVADLLRLNHQVVQRKLQAGEIPGYKLGREWRVERVQLLEWLDRFSNQRQRPLVERWFDKSGRLKAIPTQRSKRRAVLERLVELFERDRDYNEREVNAILREVHEDVAFLRREFIGEGLMTRQRGVYRRVDPPEPIANA